MTRPSRKQSLLGRMRALAVGRPAGRRPQSLRRLHVQSLEQRWPFAVGDLDTTFSFDGKATYAIDIGGTRIDRALDIAQQSDGKLLFVGRAETSATDFQGVIVRTNADGSLDTTFGGDGKVLSSEFDSSDIDLYAVKVQPDGKIVVAGGVDAFGIDFLVARLNSNGTLDTSFNSPNGYRTINFDHGGDDRDLAQDLLIQPDGKIVLAGFAQYNTSGDFDFAVARVNANGTLDTSFSSDGMATVAFDLGGSKTDVATSVALQADGKLVLAGQAQMNAFGDYDMAVARLNSNGLLDTTFSGDGRQTVAISGDEDAATDVAITSNGKIVLAGYEKVGADYDMAVVRLLDNGALDPSFNLDGRTRVLFDLGGGNNDRAWAMQLVTGDRIVVAGSAQRNSSGNFDFAVARLRTDGSPDTTFSGDGKHVVSFDIGGNMDDTPNALLIQNDGKIVLAGSATFGATDTDFAVVRLIGNALPVAVNDRYVLGSTSSINHSTVGVLANDSDADGNFISSARSASPSKGTLTLRSNGTFSYTPGSSFHGYDTFKYKPFDAYSTGNEVTVEIFSHTGALVAKAYQTVLGRAFDLPGLEYWVQRIDGGEGLSAFATGVFESRERLEPIIKNWYRQYLGREQDPSQAEVDFYYNRWRNEGGPQNMLPDIFSSQEFYQNSGGTNRGWILELYRLIVQRTTPPSEGEIAFYQTQLNNGASRQSVVRGFLFSPEKLGLIVNDLYQRILGRAPTTTEKQTEVDALGQGKTEKDLQLQLLDSDAYRSVPSKPSAGNAVRY